VRPLTPQISNEICVFSEVSVNRDHHAVRTMQTFAPCGKQDIAVVTHPLMCAFAYDCIQITGFGVVSVNVEEREGSDFIAQLRQIWNSSVIQYVIVIF